MRSQSIGGVLCAIAIIAFWVAQSAAQAADIYLAETGEDASGAGVIGHFTTSGGTVNASVVSGLTDPYGVAVAGGNMYVTNLNAETVSEYTTSGVLEHASFITGLSAPFGIAVSGGDLFVVNNAAGTIGEYNATTGATIATTLIGGLVSPYGMTISDNDIFVANNRSGTIGEYTTSGATVNSTLISGIGANLPTDVAVAGGDVFVSTFGPSNNIQDGKIEEYSLAGASINPSLVTNLYDAEGIAAYGTNLYVALFQGTVGEYTTSGATVNAALLSNLGNTPVGIVIVPEPATWIMLVIGAAGLLASQFRKRGA